MLRSALALVVLALLLAAGSAEARRGPAGSVEQPMVSDVGCVDLGECGECREAGCYWQGAGGCQPGCLVQDIECFSPLSLDACPASAQPNATAAVDANEDGCGDHSSCVDCATAGCAWNAEQCLPECSIMDVSCFRDASICPQDEAVCGSASGCVDCAEKGCIFQQGECRPECEFGPLGDFLATCVSTSDACPSE